MYFTTKAIVLSAIKYGESSRVLRCYTKEFGIQAYMINSVKSKRAVVKPSMILPLTQLDIVASRKEKGRLERIKEARVDVAYDNLAYDPVRNAVGLFLAEVMFRSIKEEEGNADKYRFIIDACNLLDGLDAIPGHFHISFLLGLCRYLGFFPDQATAANGKYFDMMEGVFQSNQPLHPHYMDEGTSKALKSLLNSGMADQQLRLPKQIRKQLLYDLLMYYKLQIDGFGNLKSLDVLEEIFA